MARREAIIVKTYEDPESGENIVDHGIGVESLRCVVLPPERFYAGWGGTKWDPELREWVMRNKW
jgi:hypothetical protein